MSELKTQKALAERLASILHAHPRGAVLTGEDAAFVLDVARDYVMVHKLADPPVAVKVRDQLCGPHPEFVAIAEDGTETNFSYRKAAKHRLTGVLPKPGRREVMSAFREAVVVQVLGFKDCRRRPGGLYVCELTGRNCTSSEIEVDHFVPTFGVLVEDYCRLRGRDLLSFIVVPREDGGYRFAEPEDHWGFGAYHREHATLRLLSKKAHASVTRLGEQGAREQWIDTVRPPEEGGNP